MSALTPLATLRATNCYELTVLSEQLIAALGPRTSYVMAAQPSAGAAPITDVMIPKEAAAYALWAPVTSRDAAGTFVVYVAESDRGARSGVLLRRANAPETAVVTAGLGSTSATAGADGEAVRSLSVLFQSVLVVERAACVELYLLDANALAQASASSPAAVTLALLGTVALPAAVHGRGEQARALLSANGVAPSSPGSQEVLIGCIDEAHHALYVQIVSVTSSSASMVRATDLQKGIALPPALRHPLVAWSVSWATQELVLLCRADHDDEEADEEAGATHCGSLSLSRADVAAGHQLTRWIPQPRFVNAATRPLLTRASDLLCTGDGAVFVVDASTGPAVVLRDIAAAALTETELPNSSISAKVLCAASSAQGVLYVVAGRQVYALAAASTGLRSAHAHTSAVASAAPALGSSTALSTAAGRLRQRLAEPAAAPAKTSDTSDESASVVAEAEAVLAALLAKGSRAQTAAVVRDVRFVQRGHHAVLQSPAFGALPADAQVRAVLRYVAVAETIHPYTVLAALAVVPHTPDKDDDGDGARLALAVLLARKRTLCDGGLQRHPDLAAAAALFVPSESYALRALAHKQLLAALCRTANSALALGALEAAAVLHTVADAMMVQVYGCHREHESQPRPLAHPNAAGTSTRHASEAEARLEADMAESIAVMKQYSQWALTDAATSLGTISAHVGDAREGRKEAYLRDARAHPIATSRNVDIKSLRLTRTQATTQQ